MQTYLIGSSSFAYALAKAYALNSIRGLLYCKFFFLSTSIVIIIAFYVVY